MTIKNLNLVPMVVEQTAAASAPTTSIRACSRSGSIFHGRRRSRTTWPTWSWPSCCSSSRKTRTRTSIVYINSPGRRRSPPGWRSTTPCSSSSRDVSTICIGQAASMGALLLAAGAKGKRFCAAALAGHDPPAARRLPGPGHGYRDPRARNPRRCASASTRSWRKHTGQPLETIANDTERDNFMSAEQREGIRPDRQGVSSERRARSRSMPAKSVRSRRGSLGVRGLSSSTGGAIRSHACDMPRAEPRSAGPFGRQFRA